MLPGDYPGQVEKIIGRLLFVLIAAAVLSLALSVLCNSEAYGADAPSMKYFPVWELKECPKDTYACYDFTKAKEIVRIDFELQMRLDECGVAESNVLELTAAVNKMEAAFNTERASSTSLLDNLRAQQQINTKLHKDLETAQRHSIWNQLPWVVTGAVVLMAASFVVGICVD